MDGLSLSLSRLGPIMTIFQNSVTCDHRLGMAYTTYKNGDLGNGLVLVFPHYFAIGGTNIHLQTELCQFDHHITRF